MLEHNRQTLRPARDVDRSLVGGLLEPGSIPCRAADKQLSAAGRAAQACSDVDGVAECGEVELLAAPDRAHERLAGMDAGTDHQSLCRQAVALDPFEDAPRGPDRADRVVVARDERDEQRHHAVAQELVDHAAVRVDRRRGRSVVRLQQLAKRRGRRPLSERRRAANISEHDADLELRAARMLHQRPEAGSTQQRVALGRPVPKEPGERPTDAMEWRGTDLASRGGGHVAPEPARPLELWILAREQGSPFGRVVIDVHRRAIVRIQRRRSKVAGASEDRQRSRAGIKRVPPTSVQAKPAACGIGRPGLVRAPSQALDEAG